MRRTEYKCKRCGAWVVANFPADRHPCGDGGRGIVEEVGLGPDDRDNVRMRLDGSGEFSTVPPDPPYTFSLATEPPGEKDRG